MKQVHGKIRWYTRVPHLFMYRSQIHERAISLRFLGILLRILKLEVSVYNVYITNQLQTTFAQGGWGVKSVSTVELIVQGEKHFVPITSKNSASVQYWRSRWLHTLYHKTRILNENHVFSCRINCFQHPTPLLVHTGRASNCTQKKEILRERRGSRILLFRSPVDRSNSYPEWRQIPQLYCWQEYVLFP